MEFDEALEPVKLKPNHILLTYPSQDTECLFRADDGMLIGERQKCVVIWGENPAAVATDPNRKQSRVFLEGDPEAFPPEWDGLGVRHWNQFGARYLREVVAVDDLRKRGIEGSPVFEERCQEGLIALPQDSLELRVNGGGAAMVAPHKKMPFRN